MKILYSVFGAIAIVVYVIMLAPRIAWSIYKRSRDV